MLGQFGANLTAAAFGVLTDSYLYDVSRRNDLFQQQFIRWADANLARTGDVRTNERDPALTGTTVTIFAQLFRYVAGNGTAGRVSGTICTFSPALTGAVSAGNISTCSVTGFSATYAAGDVAFIVIRATAAGVSLLNTISFDASIGVQ